MGSEIGLLPDGMFSLGPEAVGTCAFGVGVAVAVDADEAEGGGVRSAATVRSELADAEEELGEDDVKGHMLQIRCATGKWQSTLPK